MNVKYFNYDLKYRYKVLTEPMRVEDIKQVSANHENRIKSRACFSDMYRDLNTITEDNIKKKTHIYLQIIVERGLDSALQNKNNLYLSTNAERDLWIREIKKVVPFKHYINNIDKNNFSINIYMNSNVVQAKFVSTAVRYLFEYGFSTILHDAIKIQKQGFYNDLSLLNLVLLMSSSYLGQRDIHSLSGPYRIPRKIFDYEELKQSLEKMDFKTTSIKSYIEGKIVGNSLGNINLSETDGRIAKELARVKDLKSLGKVFSLKKAIERYENYYCKCIDRCLEELKKK